MLHFDGAGEGEIAQLVKARIPFGDLVAHGAGGADLTVERAGEDMVEMGIRLRQMGAQPFGLLHAQRRQPVIICLIGRMAVGLPVTHQN